MKALSIRQPWASLIVAGIKNVENRSWMTQYRGALLIHAGKTVTREDIQAGQALCKRLRVKFPDNLPTGGYIGIVELDGLIVEQDGELVTDVPGGLQYNQLKGYQKGSVGFHLVNPRSFSIIPAPGRLGLFVPPAEVIALLSL